MDTPVASCCQVVRLMRVFRFVMAFRTLIASIAETPLGKWSEEGGPVGVGTMRAVEPDTTHMGLP